MQTETLIHERRTIRKFSQKEISSEQLTRYINAARVAPSAANLQPLKYVGIVSREMTEKIFSFVKWAGYLAPNYNPAPSERPTAYVAVCADRTIRESGYDIDHGAAVENLILTALADGIGACWMGAIDREKISALLELPEHLSLLSVVALGYPSETPREVSMESDSIRYYLDENGTLCVPKRSLKEVLLKIH